MMVLALCVRVLIIPILCSIGLLIGSMCIHVTQALALIQQGIHASSLMFLRGKRSLALNTGTTYLPRLHVDQSKHLALSPQNRLTQQVNTPTDTEQSRELDDGDQHGY